MTTSRKQSSPDGSGPLAPETLLAAGEEPGAMPAKQPTGIRRARVLTTDVDENKRGETEVETGATRGPGGWLHSPANYELMVMGEKRLIKVARALGAAVNRVDKVRAARPKGTKLVFITPTDDEDPDGLPVGRRGSHAWINLVELLSPLKLTVAAGQKQFFRVDFAGELIAEGTYQGTPCPYEAAIVFNMDKVVETALEPKREKKEATTQKDGKGDGKANGKGDRSRRKGKENPPESATDQPVAEAGGGSGEGAAGSAPQAVDPKAEPAP